MKHDMEKIREALHRMHDHAVNNGPPYMRIPADPTEDADLILSAAIDELKALRAEVAELKASEAVAVERAQEMEMRAATARATYASMRKDIDDVLEKNAELREALERIDEQCVEVTGEWEGFGKFTKFVTHEALRGKS